MKALRTLTLALAVVAVGAGTALAQATATTGSISGTAADETGAVLPGVTVTVTSPSMQGQQVLYTDAEGNYRVPAVPPGTYRLVFELPGFTTFIREGVVVGLGFNADIDAELRVATLEETVTVTGESPVVDVASTEISTSFSAEKLANLPGARDFWAILANSPAVEVQRIDVGGSRAGTQTGYAAYDNKSTQHRPMVEGMIMTEGRGGALFYYDFGSMDEVSVQTGTHNADMGWPGVQTQFIAKSGGNEYHGTARLPVRRLAGHQHRPAAAGSGRGGRRGGRGPGHEPDAPVLGLQRGHRRVLHEGQAVGVWLGARAGHPRVPGELPGQAVPDAPEQPVGEGDLLDQPGQQGHLLHDVWPEEPGEPDERVPAELERGDPPEHGLDVEPALLGVGDQGRVELGADRPGVLRDPGREDRV